MTTSAFIRFLVVLLLFTALLLGASKSNQTDTPGNASVTQSCPEDNQVQIIETGMILESVSRHLLTAVQ